VIIFGVFSLCEILVIAPGNTPKARAITPWACPAYLIYCYGDYEEKGFVEDYHFGRQRVSL
jgi:hypothetical protein